MDKNEGLNKLISMIMLLGLLANIFLIGAPTEYPSVKNEGYPESQICGKCHTAIYKEWKNSLHASSLSDPVFLGVFNEVERDKKSFCLKCHVPTVRVTRDYDLAQSISKEGVTCDFCHTVKSVDLNKEEPFEFDLGVVKRGPFESHLKIGHKNLYSAIHLKAEFCAGCHEVVNENRFHVMSTYSEWKMGPYAEKGIQCQNCHMPEEFGSLIVNPEVAKTEHTVTAHKFQGGHTQINITKAATLTQMLDKVDDSVSVVVYITNSEAGHSLPTGIPSRRVILTVKLLDSKGEVVGEKEVVYSRVLVDGEGKEIAEKDINDMFLKAAALRSDNRIKPKETRREEFIFPLTRRMGKALTAESTLRYEFRVPYLEPNAMRMEMARDVKTINMGTEVIGIWKWIISLAGVLGLLFILRITLQKWRR